MQLSSNYLIILTTIGYFYNEVNTLNILGVFPYEGKSHFFVFQPLLHELTRKGHNLTVISHFPQKKPIENYYDISLAGKSPILEGVFPVEKSYWTLLQISFFLVKFGTENCKLLLEDENVQNLWKSDHKFDVVIVEQFNSDCPLGLAHKLGAPVVALTSHMLMTWHHERFGIQYNPSYMSSMFLDGGTKPTLYQRVERTIWHAYFNLIYKYYCQRVDESTLAKYFDDVPSLEELGRNIKFMLLYQHAVFAGSYMFPKNVIEVGGYHIAKSKELPMNLKKFIEESDHGVIYISFGSMLKAKTIPKEKLDAILGAISQLPQRVIWKWDEKNLPGNPKNIYISDWLPQNDILDRCDCFTAHPKVLAFYSHCGLLGTTEAIHHGVPMIGMPVIGDQPGNAALVEESGLGVQIEIKDLSKELLLEKFKTVLDPSFRARVKLLSKAWHDRPESAMDSAIYWTEYAGRNKNATFRSAAAATPYYQIVGLDVLGVFLAIFICFVVLVKSFLSGKVSVNSKKKLN